MKTSQAKYIRPYKIDRGIPVPLSTDDILPLADMKPGDSFTVPDSDNITLNAINNAITRFRAKNPSWRFILRTIREEHCRRVWRVE